MIEIQIKSGLMMLQIVLVKKGIRVMKRSLKGKGKKSSKGKEGGSKRGKGERAGRIKS